MPTGVTTGVTTGTVTAFDAVRGLGEVTSSTGAVHPFHCVEIVDGSRTVEVGTSVRFGLRARLGGWEAAAISPEGP
jgi:cold shock CspA family protein